MTPTDLPDGCPPDNAPSTAVERELAEVFGAPVELFATSLSTPTNPLDSARRVAHGPKPLDLRALAEEQWSKWCDHLREVGVDDAVITDLTYRTTMSLDPLTGRPRYEVGGNLDLSGTSITTLPEGLSVGGYLNLSGTPITELPEGLSVGGSLNLSDTQITALPESLSVGGEIRTEDTSDELRSAVRRWNKARGTAR